MSFWRDLLFRYGPRRGFATGEIDIASGMNVRELGGFETPSGRTLNHRFIRSGTTANISKKDAGELWGYGVRSVLDLRGTDEVAGSPERLAQLLDVHYLNVPLYDYDMTAALLERPGSSDGYLAEGYLKMLSNKAAVRAIFSFLAAEPLDSCTLFHCGAGSDRTGIVSMLLLGLVGVERKQLIADYAYSFGYIPEVNAAIFGAGTQHHVREDLAMRIDAISVAHDRLISTYGSFQHYLEECGVTDSELARVRLRLTGKQPEPAFSVDLLNDSSTEADQKRAYYLSTYHNPDKMIADLYYYAQRTRDLTDRVDEGMHDRSFHDHEYITLDVPAAEMGKLFAPVPGVVLSHQLAGAQGGSARIRLAPTGHTVYAPATCRVTAQIPSHDAIGLLTQDGVELVVSIGENPAAYHGDGFRQHAWQNDTIRRGMPLISWDATKPEVRALATVVTVEITNASEMSHVRFAERGQEIGAGDTIAVISW